MVQTGGDLEPHPLSSIIQRCSSLKKVPRIVAWVFRAVKIFKSRGTDKPKPQPVLSAAEVNDALMKCINVAKRESFAIEFNAVRARKRVPTTSRILKLTPYKDEIQLLRFGGLLDRSHLTQDLKHPIILLKHPLTELIIRNTHHRLNHSKTERILAEIRSTYWVLGGRNTVRRVLRHCMGCRRENAQPLIPLMASLPRCRLQPYSRPFSISGLDYFGPIYVQYGRGTIKRWVLLVICMNTRAVHLEMVYSLDTNSFFLAFR